MNKKISPVLAIGIIIILIIIIGILFWLNVKNENQYQNNILAKQSEDSNGEVGEKYSWKLISGYNSTDCTPHIYEGSGKISGWYSLEDVYDQKRWLFRITNVQENIPFKGDFISIIDASEELESELKKSSKDNPIEITVQGINCNCEGCSASIASVKNAFID